MLQISRKSLVRLGKHAWHVYPLEAFGYLLGKGNERLSASLPCAKTSRWYEFADCWTGIEQHYSKARAVADKFDLEVLGYCRPDQGLCRGRRFHRTTLSHPVRPTGKTWLEFIQGNFLPLVTTGSRYNFAKEAASMKNPKLLPYLLLLLTILTGCAATTANPMKINPGSVEPGSAVTMRGAEQKLIGTPIVVGDLLPATGLIAAGTMEEVNLAQEKGKVLFLSIVPSIDTKVCEAQSHYLGEQGRKMPAAIERITISRDTPFAQARFAKEAKLTNIRFLSDYKEGAFGRSVGLLLDGSRLLARAVILVDAGGVVRYIQVVPELSNLPDLDRAFTEAEKLVK